MKSQEHQVARFEPSPAALAGLGSTVRSALPLDAGETDAIVRRLADAPQERRAVWLRSGDDGILAASMSTSNPARGHVDLLAVQPDRTRCGIGGALLAAAERELADLGACEIRLGDNPPCYAWPGIDVRYTPAVCLAERHGYTRYEEAHNMSVPLSEPVTLANPPAGVQIRRCAAAEVDHVAQFIEHEWNLGWAWEASQSVLHGGLHVAWRGERPVAFAAWGANRPSWFGPMGTAPSERGGGLGAEVLRRCLSDQRAAGIEVAQIGWVGPVPFYARAVGATLERIFWLYRKEIG